MPSKTRLQLMEENAALRVRLAEPEAKSAKRLSGKGGEIPECVITERRRIEDALKSSEVRYRRLFETAKDGILILDADTGRITDANPFLQELLGYSHDELFGRMLWEIGPFKDIAASRRAFSKLQKKEYIRYDDLPLETKGRRRRHVEFISNVYKVNGTKVIQCNIRDITERKRAEEEIRRMALMLDTAPNSITVHDFDGRFVYANQRTFDLHGFTRDEFLALNLHQLDVPDSENLIAPRMQELLDRGEATFETAHYRKDGSTLPLEVSARVTTWGDKKVLLSIATDITERKRAEEQLIYQAALLANVNDAIVASDAQYRLTAWNAAAESLYGWKVEEVLGRNGLEIVRTEWPAVECECQS